MNRPRWLTLTLLFAVVVLIGAGRPAVNELGYGSVELRKVEIGTNGTVTVLVDVPRGPVRWLARLYGLSRSGATNYVSHLGGNSMDTTRPTIGTNLAHRIAPEIAPQTTSWVLTNVAAGTGGVSVYKPSWF